MSNGVPTTYRNPLKGTEPDAIPELRFRVTIGAPGDKNRDPNKKAEIGRFSECTGLTVEYEVFEYQEGGQNDFVHKFRGRAKFPNLVLKRGVTTEDALMMWFKDCQIEAKRKPIFIELLPPEGGNVPVRMWAFKDAFPVKWTGPNLNANSNNIATEQLEIAHHGFAI